MHPAAVNKFGREQTLKGAPGQDRSGAGSARVVVGRRQAGAVQACLVAAAEGLLAVQVSAQRPCWLRWLQIGLKGCWPGCLSAAGCSSDLAAA